jgi:proline iminopeptidase
MESFARRGHRFIARPALSPPDQPKDEDLWTTERFVDEVRRCRQALASTASFYLLGHSGGILAVEYAGAQDLEGLVVSGMMMVSPTTTVRERGPGRGHGSGRGARDPEIERRASTTTSVRMALLIPGFYAKHICRLPEWPDAINHAFGKLNRRSLRPDAGPSNSAPRAPPGALGRRRTSAPHGPTLVIGATADTMDPAHMSGWRARSERALLLLPRWQPRWPCGTTSRPMTGLIRFLKDMDEGKP